MANVYPSTQDFVEFGTSVAHRLVDFVCVTSVVVATSFADPAYSISVTSTATTSSVEEIDWTVTSTATVSGIVTAVNDRRFALTSTADITSFATGSEVSVFSTSTATATSTAVRSAGPEITSTATATGTDSPSLGLVGVAISNAITESYAEPGFAVLSTSTVTGTSSASSNVDRYQLSTSSATATSTAVYIVKKYDSYSSSATATSSAATQLAYTQLVTELLTVIDAVNNAGAASIALVMNPYNTAMTTYSNVRYNSLFQTRAGDIYLVGDAGIYKMTGSTDAGTAIASTAVIGLTDFKSPNKKRLDTVYLTYKGAGMTVSVGATDHTDGHSAPSYDVDIRAATTPVNSRFTVGKGLVGRYWKFTLTNKSGGDFDIYDMSAVMAESSRRL